MKGKSGKGNKVRGAGSRNKDGKFGAKTGKSKTAKKKK